ncbi:MAG: NACHT domain-containing protein, partial [Microcystis aeruginosa]
MLGDPGAGKSSLLQYLSLNWAEKELSQRVLLPLPLLIELRIYARDKDEKKCQNILEFFHQGNLICHLNQLALDDKLEKGQALVLFDGLDEVFNPQLREEIVTDIKRFSIQYPQVQIIVTSRWLGYKAEELNHAGFEHFMIQDLDKDQIEDFIKRWHDLAFENRDDKTQKQERLQKAIKESKAIRELAGNPLLLTMMAILNRTQELPRDRSKLYEKASEVLLHQWDFETKEGLIDPELKKYLYNIDLRDKRDILRLVASAMQAGEKGLAANLIYKEELENVLTQYLEKTEINKRVASDLTDLIIKQLRYRNFILCSLGGNAFAFVHRTFLEYFCACEFYERFKNRGLPDGISLEELKTKVFGEHYSDPVWKEVLCLLMGMLSAEFSKEIAEELINYLIDMEEKDQEFAYLFLAADCYGELRNQSIYVELSQRLLDILQSVLKLSYDYKRDTDFKEKTVAKIGAIWQDEPTGGS